MIRRLIILLLIVGCVFADILPNSYFLSSLNRSSIILPSNSVVDIREGINGKLYFGTSGGLDYAEFSKTRPKLEIPLNNWQIAIIRRIHQALEQHLKKGSKMVTFKNKFTK